MAYKFAYVIFFCNFAKNFKGTNNSSAETSLT